MTKELSKEDRAVLTSVIHDALTLDESEMYARFDTYRTFMNQERIVSGSAPYNDSDWDFIRAMYALFYRQGFDFAVEKISVAFNAVSEYISES